MAKLTRKQFIRSSFMTSAALSIGQFDNLASAENCEELSQLSDEKKPKDLATDEQFWAEVRKKFTLDERIINLNNGAVGPQPSVVQDAHVRLYRKSNLAPSHYMVDEIDGLRENLRKQLARFIDCLPEEVAINRNTTEGLNSVIFGLNLSKGDEVVASNYDYPFMLNAWKQREKRDGIVLKYVNLKLPIEDEDVAVSLYRNAITSKTKIVHVTHILNWTGQIMPAKKITKMAQGLGCEVIVDAAHSVGQIPVSFWEIGCDYLATSLHKWICAPFGTGTLVVRRDRISNVWPLLSAYEPGSDDIRKFEFLGTRSYPAEMAVLDALDFHLRIGSDKITARLRYLKNHWYEKITKLEGIQLHTSVSEDLSCAMATFSFENMTSKEMADKLFDSYNLHVGEINWQGLHGIRISPHIHTTLQELDVLVGAINELCEE